MSQECHINVTRKAMRTIKFRGKRLRDGEWIYGYYFVNRGEHFLVEDEFVNPLAQPEDYLVDPETVGQFTGIVDIGKREIYMRGIF